MQAITEIWRVGTVLEATVSQQSRQSISLKLEQGLVKLPLNPEQSYLKLNPDQKVWLNIEQLTPQLRITISQSSPAISTAKPLPVLSKSDITAQPFNPATVAKTSEAPLKNPSATLTPAIPSAPPMLATPPTPLNSLKQQLNLALQANAPKIHATTSDLFSAKIISQETLPVTPSAVRPLISKMEWHSAALPPSKLTPLPNELIKVSSTLGNYGVKLAAQTEGQTNVWLARALHDWPTRYLTTRQQLEHTTPELTQDKEASELKQTEAGNTPKPEKLSQLLQQLSLALPTPRQLRQNDFAESLVKHVLLAHPQARVASTALFSTMSTPTLASGLAQLLDFVAPLTLTSKGLSTDLDGLLSTLLKPDLTIDPARQVSKQANIESFTNETNDSEEWVKNLADDVARLLVRQQINWLNNARTDSQSLGLYAELPLLLKQSIDTVEILVREDPDGQREPSEHTNYVIRLRFELGPLGPVQFLLFLKDDEIAIQFYAEQPSAVELFNDFSDLLTQDLESEGIRVAEASAHQLPSVPGIRPPYSEGFHERV